MPIRVLSEQLASQIAAGEVVERPSSVVKELLENALDAGATTINITVQDGGRKLIQVADDGAGIPGAEVETAFQRHATSKIESADDLNAILTLGFRGEALAAIAAVSRVTAVTRVVDEPSGSRLLLEGGVVVARETVGAPAGTVIAVENLFHNIPARLKFLKKATTERRLIDEHVTRYALAYPGVRFRLTHDGHVTLQTAGSGSLRDVLTAIYDPGIARELLPIDEPDEEAAPGPQSRPDSRRRPLRVRGCVGPPSRHWANRNHIILFVNGRWIRDNRLTYAVVQAYHTLLPTGRYPMAVVFLELPADQVDVNVHPAKTEVRFRDPNAAFGAVQRAVRETLLADAPFRAVRSVGQAATGQPGWSGELDWHAFNRRHAGQSDALELDWGRGPAIDLAFDGPAGEGEVNGPDPSLDRAAPGGAEPHVTLGGGRLPIMRVVGQVGAAYIITEGPDGLFLIDQHAAHERILYEQFLAAQAREGIASQGLVAGTAVHLTPSQAAVVEENLDLLGRIGFTIEPFGPNAFVIRAVPAIVARRDPARVLLDVAEELAAGDVPLQSEIEARIVRRVCKTAAVKAGQTLSPTEMEALIRQLEACQNPHTCPHGRPTLIHLSVAQLAREFGRL